MVWYICKIDLFDKSWFLASLSQIHLALKFDKLLITITNSSKRRPRTRSSCGKTSKWEKRERVWSNRIHWEPLLRLLTINVLLLLRVMRHYVSLLIFSMSVNWPNHIYRRRLIDDTILLLMMLGLVPKEKNKGKGKTTETKSRWEEATE